MMTTFALVLTLVLPGQAAKPTDGERIDLGDGAILFLAGDYQPSGNKVHVLIHLHGASTVIEPAFQRFGKNVVMIEVNRNGLSGVYTKAFADGLLFPKMIKAMLKVVAEKKLVKNPQVGRVVLSTFSAGFGGAREMMKTPAIYNQIDAMILADSLYCGYDGDPATKKVSASLMAGFEKFARDAAEGRKVMILTHSAQKPEGYASTTETADVLIEAVGAMCEDRTIDRGDGWVQTRSCTKGKFMVRGFTGTEAADHMRHLRRISEVWKQLPDDFFAD